MSQLPNNITELIAALEGLGKRNLNDEFDLFWSCQSVFKKLERLSDFDPSNLKKTIKTLEGLPPEIKELKIEELGNGDEKLETKALNKQDLKELLEDYEKAQNGDQKDKIEKDFYLITGKKNVSQFIRIQNEIAAKNQEALKRLSPEVKENIVEDLVINRLNDSEKIFEIIEKAGLKSETDFQINELRKELGKSGYEKKYIDQIVQKTVEVRAEIKTQTSVEKEKQISPEIKEKIVEDLAINRLNEDEKLFEIVEKASLKEEQGLEIKELKKELKNKIKDPEKIEDLIRQVEEIRAEIKVEEKAEEIAKITYEKLLEEKLPIKKEVEAKIKNEILIAWRKGDAVKIPSELQEIKEAGVIIKEAEKAADIFKNENLAAIVNYRSQKLGREVSQELRKNGIENETLIRDYVSVVNKLTNNSETIVVEENRSEIYNFVQSENPNKGPGEIERSIDEARFMASNVVMAPKKFNKLIQRYNILREKIGGDKLPKLKEIRVVEKMSALFKESPRLLKLMNGAQGVVGTIGKITNFPSTLLSKLGGKVVEKFGGKILERIGGEAAKTFVREAAKIIAKEGLTQGTRTILTGLLSSGAAGAGGGGTAAGLVAAFAAMGPVGQVIAVAVIAVVAVFAVVKPIIDGAKKLISKITGIDMSGVKNFLSDSLGLGKFVGGVGQFVFDVGTFLIGIPALFGLISFTTIIAPVIIFFFLGIMTYSLLSQNLLSSLVPPTAVRDEICILKRSSGTGQSGEINCDQNAPENEVPGLRGGRENYFRVASGMILEGKDYASECFNDVVNRSLCEGINPLYTLWAWMHESGASNYGTDKKVQDFGINDNSIAENFDAQIKVFLRLDPASACIDDPRIKGDYWLAFATNYLTGQCDPDVGQTQTGNTGRNYLNSIDENNPGMKTTWKWIASVPMPKDIYVAKGGQNCDEEGAPPSLTGPTEEVIGEDGQVYICTTGGGSGGTIGTINIIPGQAGTGGEVTQCPFGSYSHRNIWAMDFGVPDGTPIYSTFAGVAYVGEGNGYGVYVDVHSNIDGNEFFIRYAHMPPGGNMVSNGQTVEAGQQIGDSDNNGYSTGPHLHYEVVGANINWSNAGPYFGMTQEQFNSGCGGG